MVKSWDGTYTRVWPYNTTFKSTLVKVKIVLIDQSYCLFLLMLQYSVTTSLNSEKSKGCCTNNDLFSINLVVEE